MLYMMNVMNDYMYIYTHSHDAIAALYQYIASLCHDAFSVIYMYTCIRFNG